MKIAAAASLLIASASAFTAAPSAKTTSALRMADIAPEEPTPEPELPEMSESMPFMARPAALTGELAGDVGFDPLGFAKDEYELRNYREAEIKHA